jgi:type 1 glutamine amidotransferase
MSVGDERRMDRREALRIAGGAALGWAALPVAGLGGALGAAEKPKKRILMFTRCQGFEHSVVKRNGNDLAYCEKILVDLGPKNGFEVTATKDGRLFTEGNIASFDAFIFYTSGVLTEQGGDKQPPMPAEGKQALLEAIAAGKGFVGIHSANDSFHSKGDGNENQPEDGRDPYIRMVGGEFIRHGPQQEAAMQVASPKFPGCEGLGESFRLNDEWYTHKNFAPDLHVILVQETKGMEGSDYQRPPFPSTWARRNQKGRVFYTSMGHREDVWTNETFRKILLGGIAWALGDVDAPDLTANMAKATPEASKLQPKPK